MLKTISVFLTVDGQEVFAKGGTLYAWHFSIYMAAEDHEYNKPAPDSICIAEDVLVELPPIATCIKNVLAKLSAKENEIQAQAYKDSLEIKQRRDDLLMIGHEAPKEVE